MHGGMSVCYIEGIAIYARKAQSQFILPINHLKFIARHAGGQTSGMRLIMDEILTSPAHFLNNFKSFNFRFRESPF